MAIKDATGDDVAMRIRSPNITPTTANANASAGRSRPLPAKTPRPTANAVSSVPTPPTANVPQEQHTTPKPTHANAVSPVLTPPANALQEQHTTPKPTHANAPADKPLSPRTILPCVFLPFPRRPSPALLRPTSPPRPSPCNGAHRRPTLKISSDTTSDGNKTSELFPDWMPTPTRRNAINSPTPNGDGLIAVPEPTIHS